MIEAQGLTKQYGEKIAVDNLSFTVQPGVVTDFLGPNGAGKSTTMRMILGLDAPTSGRVTLNGRAYAEHPAPLHEVGALLEARAIHTGRSGANHLLAMAATTGIGRRRVEDVVDVVGLREVADKRAGGFSLGMGQRLGSRRRCSATPGRSSSTSPSTAWTSEGVRWIRTRLRQLADEGRTVFLSSHLMSEMALTAEHLIVVGRGRLIRDMSVDDFTASASTNAVYVRSPDDARLHDVLLADGIEVASSEPGHLQVTGMPATTSAIAPPRPD
jgi:ABC-2 type transport system ATP-binding protein